MNLKGTPLFSYQQEVQETLEKIIDKVELPLSEKVTVLTKLFSTDFTLEIYKSALADSDPFLIEPVRNAKTISQLDLLFENSNIQERVSYSIYGIGE